MWVHTYVSTYSCFHVCKVICECTHTCLHIHVCISDISNELYRNKKYRYSRNLENQNNVFICYSAYIHTYILTWTTSPEDDPSMKSLPCWHQMPSLPSLSPPNPPNSSSSSFSCYELFNKIFNEIFNIF